MAFTDSFITELGMIHGEHRVQGVAQTDSPLAAYKALLAQTGERLNVPQFHLYRDASDAVWQAAQPPRCLWTRTVVMWDSTGTYRMGEAELPCGGAWGAARVYCPEHQPKEVA